MELESKQAEMKERMAAATTADPPSPRKRKRKPRLLAARRYEAKRSAKKRKAAGERADVVCRYCLKNTTRASVRAREIPPCRSCRRVGARLKKYGLDLLTYFKMLRQQDNRCGICNRVFKKSPHIDHCHDREHVRGLLCHSCNLAIGLLGNASEVAKNALKYLQFNKLKRTWWLQRVQVTLDGTGSSSKLLHDENND